MVRELKFPGDFPSRTTSDPPVPNGTFPGSVPSGAKKKVQTCVIGRPPGRLIGGSGGRSPPVRKKLKLVSGRASCAWARRQSSGDTSSVDWDWERWKSQSRLWLATRQIFSKLSNFLYYPLLPPKKLPGAWKLFT